MRLDQKSFIQGWQLLRHVPPSCKSRILTMPLLFYAISIRIFALSAVYICRHILLFLQGFQHPGWHYCLRLQTFNSLFLLLPFPHPLFIIRRVLGGFIYPISVCLLSLSYGSSVYFIHLFLTSLLSFSRFPFASFIVVLFRVQFFVRSCIMVYTFSYLFVFQDLPKLYIVSFAFFDFVVILFCALFSCLYFIVATSVPWRCTFFLSSILINISSVSPLLF